MRPRRLLAAMVLTCACACGGDRTRSTPSGSTTATRDSTAAIAVVGEWPHELGTILVVPSDTESLGVVAYPAVPVLQVDSATLALIDESGRVVGAKVRASGRDSARCGDAPMLRMRTAGLPPWIVGMAPGSARVLRSDSLEGLSHADSARYATEAARLASQANATTTSPATGLAFVLVAMRRIKLADGEIVVAQLVRRVNQEASPVEEHTFLVADGDRGGQLSLAYSDRSEGAEESAAHFELLAAVEASGSQYLLVLADAPAATTVKVLHRTRSSWRVVWSRTIAC